VGVNPEDRSGPSSSSGMRRSHMWAIAGLSFGLALAVAYVTLSQRGMPPHQGPSITTEAPQTSRTEPAAEQPPRSAPPPGAVGEQLAAEDPCAALLRVVSAPPTRSQASELLAGLDGVPTSCLPRVPVEWQIELARAACAAEERRTHCPGTWALPALEALVRDRSTANGGGETECLVRVASTVPATEASRLASILASGFAAFPSWPEVLLTVRSASEHDWWRAFWQGLAAEDASGFKEKLYAAMGALSGREGLMGFVRQSAEWEDVETTEGVLGLAAASTVLVRYMPEEAPSPSVLVPSSPRLRMVMLHSVPPHLSWPFVEDPWFSRSEVHSEVSRLFLDASDDIKERRWREDWIGNEWTFSGFERAMAAFRSAFPESVASFDQFDHWQRIRLGAALRALAQLVTTPLPASGRLAEELRRALDGVLSRGSPRALTTLVLSNKATLVDPTARSLLVEILKDRLEHLDARARTALGC